MTTYSGLCIGGPLAGQSVAKPTRGFAVSTPMQTSWAVYTDDQTRAMDINIARYVHMDKLAGAPVSLWVLSDATLEDIVRELAANYKPKGDQ